MSGAFPISTAKFGTLGIKSIQNTIISKSVSGKRLVRQIDNQKFAFTVQIITAKKIRCIWRFNGFYNETKKPERNLYNYSTRNRRC